MLDGEKPGAYVTTIYHPETRRVITTNAVSEIQYAEGESPLVDFLETFGLAYRRDKEDFSMHLRNNGRTTKESVIRYNYYIADDQKRINGLPDTISDADCGEFLGYPEHAIRAFDEGITTSPRDTYRPNIRALMQESKSDSFNTLDHLYYLHHGYVCEPTVDNQREQYRAFKAKVDLREAYDEALDIDYIFTREYYEDIIRSGGRQFNDPRLLWWLLFYQILGRLRSSPNRVRTRLGQIWRRFR